MKRTEHAERIERRTLLRALAAFGLAASIAQPMAAEPALGLVQLMQTLAQVKSGEATFVEKRSVTMLERTLESSGRLSFNAPDTFLRETLKPRNERLEITGNMLTMSQGKRSRTVTLDSVPEAAVLIEAIRGTLTGNREALERNFVTTVSGDARQWQLELVPREPRLRELVASVRVSGRQALVREVVVAMADGDRSVMTLEPTRTGPAPPASAASAPG